ncbi:NADP-dependent oxidoreductase [Amycolatopsis sp. NPDC006125]|uniref:NADP-dependent oxidoreductase n=1 Tax=Amycolatopsis sp. NPDC006125 TaxID=3156730 RepID=UPI0033B9B981
MRAVLQRAWGDPLEVAEVPAPRPAPGDVLVRVFAAGVNPVDHYTAIGQAYNMVLSLPHTHGWDVTGAVEQVGYGVTRFAPGDRVYGMPWFPRAAGAFADYLTAPARHLAPMPEGLGFTDAAALPLAGLTAWQILTEVAGVSAGQRVLVSGAAGGVGHLAVQIAKARGAYVIGTASPPKHEFVRALGADEVTDHRTGPPARDVDVVVQMFGGEHGLTALRALRPGGLLVSGQSAWTPGLHERAAELGVRAVGYLVDPDAAGLAALTDLVHKGQLSPHVSETLPLAEAQRALNLLAEGRTTGKLVLTVTD